MRQFCTLARPRVLTFPGTKNDNADTRLARVPDQTQTVAAAAARNPSYLLVPTPPSGSVLILSDTPSETSWVLDPVSVSA